jgi:3',5'-cyclic AMP phosphodiesterase CpdA
MCRFCRASIFIILILCTALLGRADAQSVTFAQLTDVHFFDAGKKRLPLGAREEFLENRAALDWAVLEINRLQASGKTIDFVVFTGDLGLEVVKPPEDEASAADLARSFQALVVRTIYFLPGNNDLEDEDPAKIVRYQAFLARLKSHLSGFDAVDLTSTTQTVHGIRFIGLDSASFKNDRGKTTSAHRSVQLSEMRRVQSQILDGQPCAIFTHIPDLEDPYRGPNGDDAHPSWNLAPDVAQLWGKILERREVLGVFAGHFHDSRRAIYSQDYTWAKKKPDEITAHKTWIVPPLALKNQDNAPLPARGFFLVTLTGAGKVSVEPHWLARADGAAAPDKADKLIEADAEAQAGNWTKAAEAYRDALSSKDAQVRAAAQEGFYKSHAKMRKWYWPLLDTIAPLRWATRHTTVVTILVLCLLLLVIYRYRRRRPIIEMPVKASADAPVEIFAAQIAVAANDVRRVYSYEALQWRMGFDARGLVGSSSRLIPGTAFFAGIAESLPDIQGVSLSKIAKLLHTVIHFFCWRVESGLSITPNGDITAYASLRWGWMTSGTWVESLAGSESPDRPRLSGTPEAAQLPLPLVPGPAANAADRLREVAWRIACDILGSSLLQ